jgi:protein tyrosine phosphatase
MVNRVQKEGPLHTMPVLVHCSAGVGRTGTFLAVNHAQEQLRVEGVADPLKIVETLRSQRPAMVQHLSQFFFVHDCITDWAEDSGKAYEVQSSDALGQSTGGDDTFDDVDLDEKTMSQVS